MHMPSEHRYNYFALTQESTSLWVEGAPIHTENQGVMNTLVKKYGIHCLNISPYHPPINGGIEWSNQTFKESLSKLNNGTAQDWTHH